MAARLASHQPQTKSLLLFGIRIDETQLAIASHPSVKPTRIGISPKPFEFELESHAFINV